MKLNEAMEQFKKAESRIQAEIVEWFRNEYCLKFHKPRYVIYSVPNERKNKRELAGLIATGLMGGVSDLVVLLENRSLYIEVKDDTNTQQPNQREFEAQITALGFKYYIVRSLEEFKNVIKIYI